MDEKAQRVREEWAVALFLLAFLVFNIVTATSYPFPHLDESLHAEPAINYSHGLGFGIRFDEILGMYSFLLVPWMKLFGSSLQSIRSADIISITAALFVLWSAVKRLNIIPLAFWRVFLLILLATEYGMIVVYRNGRYDGFGALLMTLVLWLMSIERKRTRLFCLFVICLLVPWAGMQFVPVLFAAGLFLFLIFRWRFWMEIAISFLASVLGAAGFFLVAAANGRLPSLLKFIRGPKNRHRCHFRLDPSWATHPLQLYSRRFQPTFSFFRRSHRVGSSSAPKQNQSAFGDLLRASL
jgi:hypothetical protein